MAETQEKDVDLSTDRNTERTGQIGAERSSLTGTDTKSLNTSVDNAVDVGEAEATRSSLAASTTFANAFGNQLLQQMARQNELNLREQSMQMMRAEELSVIKQRQLNNSADVDKFTNEATLANIKGRNSQDQRHAGIEADRLWNPDEVALFVTEMMKRLAISSDTGYAAILKSLAGVLESRDSAA